MTLQDLFAKLDQESDRQGAYFFHPLPIAEQAIREAIERARQEYPSNVEHPHYEQLVAEVDTHNAAIDQVLKELGIEKSDPKA